MESGTPNFNFPSNFTFSPASFGTDAFGAHASGDRPNSTPPSAPHSADSSLSGAPSTDVTTANPFCTPAVNKTATVPNFNFPSNFTFSLRTDVCGTHASRDLPNFTSPPVPSSTIVSSAGVSSTNVTMADAFCTSANDKTATTPNFNFPSNFTCSLSPFGTAAFGALPSRDQPNVTSTPTGDASCTVIDADLENFMRTLNDFERKLGKPLLSKEEDGVISVPSALILLGLLYPGTGGDTAAQLEALVGVGDQQLETLANFKKYISCLEVPEIAMGNIAYVNRDVVLKEAFVEKGKEYFNVTINQLDFSKTEACVSIINTWVQQKTRNLIQEIVNASNIKSSDTLILLNSIYFKGKWSSKFKPHETKSGEFTTFDGQMTVQYMLQTNDFQYARDEDYQYLIMPYLGGKLSMLIILPKDIETFKEKDVSKVDLTSLKFWRCKVKVKMPKFSSKSDIDWKSILQSAIPSVFSTSVDLQGLSDTPIWISRMIQKAVIKVDEEGTEAAAVTAMFGVFGSAARPPERITPFLVTRPFYYHIQMNVSLQTKVSLFSGHVVKPCFSQGSLQLMT